MQCLQRTRRRTGVRRAFSWTFLSRPGKWAPCGSAFRTIDAEHPRGWFSAWRNGQPFTELEEGRARAAAEPLSTRATGLSRTAAILARAAPELEAVIRSAKSPPM